MRTGESDPAVARRGGAGDPGPAASVAPTVQPLAPPKTAEADHERRGSRRVIAVDDQERALAHALGDLAPRDERARRRSRRHRLAEQLGQRRPLEAKCVTRPAARAASSTPPGRRRRRRARAARRARAGRRPARPAARRPSRAAAPSSTATRTARARAPRSRSSSTPPDATSRPSVDDRHRLAQALDELELVARRRAPARRARRARRRTPLSTSTPTGSSPENGSSSTSTLGLVHQRGRELDALLVAERELLHPLAGALGEPEPLDPAVAAAARRRRPTPCSRAR